MILGASYSQLPLYEAARQLGVSTVAASTPGDWPGFAVLMRGVYADITSPEAILKAAQEKEIDGIATCCLDAGVRALGYTCEQMGLIGPSAKSAGYQQRQIQNEGSLYGWWCALCETYLHPQSGGVRRGTGKTGISGCA